MGKGKVKGKGKRKNPMKSDKEPAKRKRVVLSIEEKVEALRRVDRGEMLTEVALDYGVSANTVGDWRRNRQILEDFSKSQIGDRKSTKVPDFTYEWFQQQNNKDMCLPAPIIKANAEILAKNAEEVEALKKQKSLMRSDGWLYK